MSATDNSSAFALANDFSRRVILPTSAAVKGPRFQRRQWELSAQVREILDDIHAEVSRASVKAPAPRAERNVDPAESIVMSGNEILNSMRTGDHVVKQRRIVDLPTLPELSFVDAPAVEAPATLQDDASAALAQINRRRVAPARRPAPTPSARPWAFKAVAYVLASGGLVFVALALARAL